MSGGNRILAGRRPDPIRNYFEAINSTENLGNLYGISCYDANLFDPSKRTSRENDGT
ncbi:Hypothetical protein FKW44_007960 [Caligus rogercresseyi]|uniref:Uncharacterized protein n=1 Tax=Caligus rogercresseyi TaxID=217165 RepID=A0A7T8KFG1_CALRO|nr:Hypothetical protein FKW44_007960 [Caligus rogercresseyi]